MFTVSNYPDGMTSRDWAHIDGIEHHEDCPQHENFFHCEDCLQDFDFDTDCECGTLYLSKEDIELEKLGL
jgi:hypothetical protein